VSISRTKLQAYHDDSSANALRAIDLDRINTLRTGDADLRFYITTVQDG